MISMLQSATSTTLKENTLLRVARQKNAHIKWQATCLPKRMILLPAKSDKRYQRGTVEQMFSPIINDLG